MPKYHIWTIGCQMNKAESDRLASRFEEIGYQPAAKADDADLIVLNSCVVRQSAENRVVNKLHALKSLKKTRPDMTLALTGCLVDSDTSTLRRKYPYVDHFFMAGGSPPWLVETDTLSLPRRPSPAAFVTIIQGCDNFCSYCIVPYRRGREKSRPVAEISLEVRELVKRGAKEITLLGQNVDSYGHDLPGKPDLADLLAVDPHGTCQACGGCVRVARPASRHDQRHPGQNRESARKPPPISSRQQHNHPLRRDSALNSLSMCPFSLTI